MKKIVLLVLVLLISLIVCACSKVNEFYLTIAAPFSDEQTKAFGLQKADNNYNLENVQVFNKEDGKRVIFVYSAPIEMSSDIIEEGNEYITKGSYFSKIFPSELSKNTPIEMHGTDNFAKIYLNNKKIEGGFSEKQNVFGLKKQSVIYNDAFGKGIDYICYPTSFGVNTEIILSKRSENNKFQIKIQLPQLVPDTNSPDYILFKSAFEKGVVKSILYTPIAVDKNGKWCYANSVKIVDKDSENNIYTVEYEIDQKFLADKSTKFPVTLNQSIHLYKPKQPDTSAYENTGDVASHYLSPYILLGDKTLKGEGWTYVRYETLYNLHINPEKIVSAKYVFHNLFDLKKETKISAYAVTADWCSINTRWFNRPPFDDKPIYEVVLKESGDYKLDITSLFVEMMKNKSESDAKYSVQNSFMIRSDTNDSNVILSSGDNGLFSPMLEIVLSE